MEEAFPYLRGEDTRTLTAKYEFEGKQRGPWDEFLALRAQIDKLRLELWRRGFSPVASSKGVRLARSKSWQDVQITFLSDERVEICGGKRRETYNYGELGFEDRRNGKPSRAWVMLREMATRNGTMPIPPTTAGRDLAMIQKRIQEIRGKLRSYFQIEGNPIPLNNNTYQTNFKVSCGPSFNV